MKTIKELSTKTISIMDCGYLDALKDFLKEIERLEKKGINCEECGDCRMKIIKARIKG